MLPNLFHIGPLEIHSYGTLLMLGFFIGIWLSYREARRLGLSSDLPIDLGIWVMIGSVIFARAVFVALNWQSDYDDRPLEALYIWREGGLSFHGGLIGGAFAGLLFARRRKVSFWALADMVAPGLALGYAITRFGCLLNGCCYGAPTSLPWGIRFPLFPGSSITTPPSHPTQIYSTLGSLAIFGILMWLRKRLPIHGQLFLIYLMLYSIVRSAVEVLRKGYTAQIVFDGLTQAQVVSIIIFLTTMIGLIWLRSKANKMKA